MTVGGLWFGAVWLEGVGLWERGWKFLLTVFFKPIKFKREMTLNDVIDQANRNVLILPSFQRGFKWKPENIRKLLESLVLDYPIGAVLLWQTNNDIFEWRTLESVEIKFSDDNGVENEKTTPHTEHTGNRYKYILDGQQRLTSIYKIFPSHFNKTPFERQHGGNTDVYRFFIDLNKLNFPNLNKENFKNYEVDFPSNIEDIADSCLFKNFQNIRKEYRIRYRNLPENLPDNELEELFKEKNILPLTRSFLTGDISILNRWISQKVFTLTNQIGGGEQTHKLIEGLYSLWLTDFSKHIQTVLIQKSIPVISIPESASWEGLSRIFETINSTGLSLTTFDLLVAKLSSWGENGGKNLRNVILKTFEEHSQLLDLFDDKKNLGGAACQQLPRIFSLNAAIHENRKPSLKKSEILGLKRENLIAVANISCNNLKSSLQFLREYLGVKDKAYLPFKDAITLTSMVSDVDKRRFEAYYWYVLFTEKDLDKDSNSVTKRLYDNWLDFRIENKEKLSNEVKNKLEELFPSFEDVLSVSNSTALLYKAFLTFVFAQSTFDWADINVKDELEIEDHHIFPKQWLNANINNVSNTVKDNILNRVLVSRKANGPNGAGNTAPHIYLRDFKKLDSFLIPNSFLNEMTSNEENLRAKLRDRYDLLKDSIFKKIHSAIMEEQP
jgi:uncharacterized protein with ParB-like and HNH nuclease domain